MLGADGGSPEAGKARQSSPEATEGGRREAAHDGRPPGAAHGADVDDHGNGVVVEQRLHQLIRRPGPVTDRTFEIFFLDPEVQAYAFTFG
jgi:Thioredoxin like C-terminal domain